MDADHSHDEPIPGAGPEDERRRARREHLAIAVRIDTSKRPDRFGMTRNISRTGALLATPSRFSIGERALLRFVTGEGVQGKPVQARIVRLELNPDDPVGVWPYFMAVRFLEPLEAPPVAAN
jgi:hypothetical protein